MSLISSHLTSTLNLIEKTYSNNDFEEDYYAVIKILYGDRNLAIVLSHFTQKSIQEVTNDMCAE